MEQEARMNYKNTFRRAALILWLLICIFLSACVSVNVDNDVLETGNISTLDAGYDKVFAVDTGGMLWGWGQNTSNTLQIESDESLFPIEVIDSVKSVSNGIDFVMVVRMDDTLWGWGNNKDGQMGLWTNTEIEDIPIKIMDDVSAVSSGWGFSAVLKKDDSLWVAGSNHFGILGKNTSTTVPDN